MFLGIDVSTYFEVIGAHKKFYKGDEEIDIFKAFKDNGVDSVRIRLWNDPYDKEGHPYLGGTNNLASFIKLAKICQSYGFRILLDLHYSDFWCDPSKQTLPKAWEGMDNAQIEKAIYAFTRYVLEESKKNKIDIEYIQIGNEITNGMCWPNGKLIDQGDGTRRNYETVCSFLKQGIKASKEIYPDIKTIIHLERSFDNPIYTEYCKNLIKNNVDYDILGVSYYPYWHKTFKDLFANLNNIKSLIKKPIMIVETGYAFTMDSYKDKDDKENEAKLLIDERFLKENAVKLEFPLTEEGQDGFIKKLISLSQENGIAAIYYWEPCWLPGKGICWASEAGLKYTHEENKTTRNEWANQCLFDYDGKMLKGFEDYTIKKEKE